MGVDFHTAGSRNVKGRSSTGIGRFPARHAGKGLNSAADDRVSLGKCRPCSEAKRGQPCGGARILNGVRQHLEFGRIECGLLADVGACLAVDGGARQYARNRNTQ